MKTPEPIDYSTAYHYEWYQTREGFKAHVDKIVSWFCDKGGTLFNVGCGDGLFEFLISKRNPHLTLLGVDIDEKAITFCRQKVVDANVSFVVSDAFSFSSKFDYVLCSEVIEHICDRSLEDMIKHLAMSCSKGLYLTSPIPSPLIIGESNSAGMNSHHFKEYSHEEIKTQLIKYFKSIVFFELGASYHFVCEDKI